jgi:hypothetical protein
MYNFIIWCADPYLKKESPNWLEVGFQEAESKKLFTIKSILEVGRIISAAFITEISLSHNYW